MTNPNRPSDALVKRMDRFVRYYERNKTDDLDTFGCTAMDEARAIVAELPKPVDPDLLIVRETIAKLYNVAPWYAQRLRAGDLDHTTEVKSSLACLRIGREQGK